MLNSRPKNSQKNPLFPALLVASLTWAFAAATPAQGTAPAQGAAATDGQSVAADDVQPFAVRVVGPGPRPIFLIPGLGSPGEIWTETATALVEEGYTAHIFTLAGFAGLESMPSGTGDLLPRVHGALIERARQLDEAPALVGHSLGAVMSLWVAASEPDLFGPVVAVDGVPFLPALTHPGATAESAGPQAESMRAMISAMTPEAFDRQTAFTLSTMITDPAEARRVAEMSKGSDPRAIAEAMGDLMTRDLRAEIATIEDPVLLIGAGAPAATAEAAAELESRYRQQVAAVPDHRVVMIESARHFVMVDAPQRMLELIVAHLEGAHLEDAHRQVSFE